MVWSRSDTWMVTADHGGYVKYWQSNMNNVKMFQAHKEPVRAIRWASTEDKFLSIYYLLRKTSAFSSNTVDLLIVSQTYYLIINNENSYWLKLHLCLLF